MTQLSASARGDIIAVWTFPSTSPLTYSSSVFVSDPYAANIGTGTLIARRPTTSYHYIGVGSGNSTIPPTDDGTDTLRTGAVVSSNLMLDFEFSTLSQSGISISLDGTKTTFNPSASMSGQFSLDGGSTFVSGVGMGVPRDAGWQRTTLDLSSFPQFNDQSSVLLRFSGRADGIRDLALALDNVTISSSTSTAAVPEPASWCSVLLGTLLVAGSRFRRWRWF
ncbi:MAG: hypothetical protein KDA85_22030 [Planctomycetaceae bacterium]|nr:hypothetical protein [Planctomycetaceae bacterium]